MPGTQEVCITGIFPWVHTALNIRTARCTVQIHPGVAVVRLSELDMLPLVDLNWTPTVPRVEGP